MLKELVEYATYEDYRAHCREIGLGVISKSLFDDIIAEEVLILDDEELEELFDEEV